MSHPGTEETLFDEGESASGLWWRFGFWFWFLFGVFCLVLEDTRVPAAFGGVGGTG